MVPRTADSDRGDSEDRTEICQGQHFIGEARMPQYTFTLSNFGVYHTRARHNDTDWAAISLQVGANSFGTRTFAYGDINNAGDEPLYAFLPGNSGWSFDSIDIPDPEASIGFSYQIANAGHGSPNEIMARL